MGLGAVGVKVRTLLQGTVVLPDYALFCHALRVENQPTIANPHGRAPCEKAADGMRTVFQIFAAMRAYCSRQACDVIAAEVTSH